MKNNKGFTLVELLAVVTIIGVLLTLATAAAITTMNKGKRRAEKLSAKDYVTAVNDYNYISSSSEKITTSNCNCSLVSSNLIRCKIEGSNGLSAKIEDSLEGRLPKSGTVDINTTTYKVKSARIKVKNYTVIYENSKYKIN